MICGVEWRHLLAWRQPSLGGGLTGYCVYKAVLLLAHSRRSRATLDFVRELSAPEPPPPPGTKKVVSGAFCSVWVDRGVSGSGAALYSPGSPRQHGAGLMCSRFILDFKKWPVRTSSELMEVHCHDAGLLTVMLQMPSSTPSHKQVSPMLA